MEHALELRPVRNPLSVLTPRREAAAGQPDAWHTILAAAAGDREAFAALYADYRSMVHAILLGRVPRRDVDDLLQDVFLTAFTRLKGLREPAAFGGWLATIARNRATDHLRQTREHIDLPDELPGGEPIQAETFAVLE